MKIAKAEAIPLAIPFSSGGKPAGWGGQAWTTLDMVLIRVETESGLVGWGEAFGYRCRRAVQAAFEDMVAPVVVGRDARDIAGLSHDLQQGLHLFGRYGITMFALSGLDIALWDLAGKAAGLPLCQLLGGPVRSEIPGYAIEKRKMPIDAGLAARAQSAIEEAFAGRTGATLDRQDGLRLDFDAPTGAGRGWLHARPSNTEPIFRLIAEAPTASEVESILDDAERAIQGD